MQNTKNPKNKQKKSGSRKNSVEVFQSLQKSFDRFLDFSRSLADQQTMAELAACYTLATYFTEAFNVVGQVWATGEKGSGKTQLLLLICELSYLGQFIQASESLASLRDLADYGAFLGFDDAEQVTDKNFDPDKRNLLLAGNRRGSTITIKEAVPNSREWRTRYVNTFCPRGFSATRKPDDILGSRTITIPLIRTSDKRKGDADPLDETCWTQKPNELRQDLWLVALAHLAEMRDISRRAADRTALTGRDLEGWRGVLAVAALLDAKDTEKSLHREIKGKSTTLFDRMSQLSLDYQSYKLMLETSDYTKLTLRAIAHTIATISDESKMLERLRESDKKEWRIRTQDIVGRAKSIVTNEDLDFDVERVNSRVIGRKLGALRFDDCKVGAKSEKGWRITLSQLESLILSYNLVSPDVTSETSDTQNITSETTCNSEQTVENTPKDSEFSVQQDVSDVTDYTDVNNEANNNTETYNCENCPASVPIKEDICPECSHDNTPPF